MYLSPSWACVLKNLVITLHDLFKFFVFFSAKIRKHTKSYYYDHALLFQYPQYWVGTKNTISQHNTDFSLLCAGMCKKYIDLSLHDLFHTQFTYTLPNSGSANQYFHFFVSLKPRFLALCLSSPLNMYLSLLCACVLKKHINLSRSLRFVSYTFFISVLRVMIYIVSAQLSCVWIGEN